MCKLVQQPLLKSLFQGDRHPLLLDRSFIGYMFLQTREAWAARQPLQPQVWYEGDVVVRESEVGLARQLRLRPRLGRGRREEARGHRDRHLRLWRTSPGQLAHWFKMLPSIMSHNIPLNIKWNLTTIKTLHVTRSWVALLCQAAKSTVWNIVGAETAHLRSASIRFSKPVDGYIKLRST